MNVDDFGPELVVVGTARGQPYLVEFGVRIGPRIIDLGPRLVNSIQIRSMSARSWSRPQSCSKSAEVGRPRPKLGPRLRGRHRPKLGRLRGTQMAEVGTTLAGSGPSWAERGSNEANMGPALVEPNDP